MLSRTALAACLALSLALLAAPAAFAADARFEGASADGSVAFFSTVDKLVPGDTDTKRDVYARSYEEGAEGFVTRQVSFGPIGGNNAFDAEFLAVPSSGGLAFFATRERLAAADTDFAEDIYVRDLEANTTTLVTAGDSSCAGSGCGNGENGASPVPGGVVADGGVVFFSSAERLSTADADDAPDVYARDLAEARTVLVSIGDESCEGPGCGNGPAPASFRGAADDGSRAFFASEESLVPADADGELDVYGRDLGLAQTMLATPAGTCPAEADCAPNFVDASTTGSAVFFETRERIDAADTDDSQDLYRWSEGAVSVVSQGPAGGNGGPNVLYAGSSPDGATVFFETKESLVAADTDGAQDLYARGGGETELVSVGAETCEGGPCDEDASVARRSGVPSGVFAEGSRVFFVSSEPLAAGDEDVVFDIYLRDLDEGTTTLVSGADPSCSESSCGAGPIDAKFAGASADASRAFFVTDEPLADTDADAATDVYERAGEATTRVSVGSINGNLERDAQLQGLSDDGARAFFATGERLTGEDDFAGEEDVYERSGGATVLVSQGNDKELEEKLAPPPPELEATDPASPSGEAEPRVLGSEAELAAAIKIYATPDCSGEPIGTGGAEELADPGIGVKVGLDETTEMRATAEAEGFISVCSEAALSYTHEAAEPPPGGGGGGGGGGGSGGAGGGGSSDPSAAPPSGAAPIPLTPAGLAYVAPLTRITFGPAFKTRRRRPVFRFADATGQPGTRFICRVDRRRWRRCGSPARLRGLGRGRHVFKVKARNAVGVWERRVSRRRFKMTRGDRKGRKARRGNRRGRR